MKEKPQGESPHCGERRHTGVFSGFSFALSEADKVNCRIAAREGGLGQNPPAGVTTKEKPILWNRSGKLTIDNPLM